MKWATTTSMWAFIIRFSVSAGLLALLLPLSGCKDVTFDNPLDPNASKAVVNIINVVESTRSGNGDIGFDGEKLWKFEPRGNIVAIHRDSGAVIREYDTAGGGGGCFFEDVLYLCGNGENILYIVDPLSGDELNRISTTGIIPAFIAPYGDTLAVYDSRSQGMFLFNPETGLSEHLFDVSGINIGGIDVYKGALLITDMNTDSIYHFSMDGAVMNAISAPASGIGGITVDYNDYVYLFMLSGSIYKVALP